MPLFDLPRGERLKLWQELTALLEDYYSRTKELRVAPELEPEEVVRLVSRYSFDAPVSAGEALRHVISGIKKYGVQTAHPGYFGLFNPRPNFASIMADMITATLNPQMAAWSHAPFAVEAEHYLVSQFGLKFGFPGDSIDGVFCGGGAEANHTAVLCALNRTFPEYAVKGLSASSGQPTLYCSSESHHSIGKAAMMTGIGLESVRSVEADKAQHMQVAQLEQQIVEDIRDGKKPFLIVATAGTTGSGAIDPLPALAAVAHKYGLWLHTDAAWGGAAILDPDSRHVLKGIEQSDSITFDMHKWMSVPMGTSIFITRDRKILSQTFGIAAGYMPQEADALDITDPYLRSMQWSRRFIGLRTYLSLLIFGWEGYARTVNHQVKTGRYLKKQLARHGWEVTNNTELPVACFTDPRLHPHDQQVRTICDQVLRSGKSWISVYPLNGKASLRACITNYATTPSVIDDFVALLNQSRENIMSNQNKINR